MKEKLLVLFTDCKQEMEKIKNENITVRDFDFLLAGFLTGFSVEKDFNDKDIKEISDYIVNSDLAKEIGVTGTLLESFKKVNYE